MNCACARETTPANFGSVAAAKQRTDNEEFGALLLAAIHKLANLQRPIQRVARRS